MSSIKPRVSALITDLDNTLFDWFEFWYESFSALIDEVQARSGIERERLLQDAQRIHQRHGTSEYSFLLQEMDSLKERHPGQELTAIYDSAIHAYRSARKRTLRLYPTVIETLRQLRAAGTLIVAYTESMGYYSAWRVKRLGLDGILDVLYSQEDHDLPEGLSPDQVRALPTDQYELQTTLHRHTPRRKVKPSPELLTHILSDTGAHKEMSVYLGDSLTKDILMAQRAHVPDVWAAYGSAHLNDHQERYELLRQVTHWTPTQVEHERTLSRQEANPTYVLQDSFSEVLSLFSFERFVGARE